MKRYLIKSRPGRSEYLDIIHETEEGYTIRLTREIDGDVRVKEEYIDRHLFDVCVKTGYLSELAGAEFALAS
jgi:hypothetical protein